MNEWEREEKVKEEVFGCLDELIEEVEEWWRVKEEKKGRKSFVKEKGDYWNIKIVNVLIDEIGFMEGEKKEEVDEEVREKVRNWLKKSKSMISRKWEIKEEFVENMLIDVLVG